MVRLHGFTYQGFSLQPPADVKYTRVGNRSCIVHHASCPAKLSRKSESDGSKVQAVVGHSCHSLFHPLLRVCRNLGWYGPQEEPRTCVLGTSLPTLTLSANSFWCRFRQHRLQSADQKSWFDSSWLSSHSSPHSDSHPQVVNRRVPRCGPCFTVVSSG